MTKFHCVNLISMLLCLLILALTGNLVHTKINDDKKKGRRANGLLSSLRRKHFLALFLGSSDGPKKRLNGNTQTIFVTVLFSC